MPGVKAKLSSHAGEFMAVLLILQPLLDMLSYFMQEAGSTVVTTSLRMALLVLVSLYGFAISDRKQWYAALYGAVAGFWLLHVLNCVRIGYRDPVGDAAEYLKLVQFPLWTASFLTFFRKREELDLRITGALTADFALILLVIGLSYAAGMPVFTYDFPEREIQIGILGWFGVANAQSAILCLVVPGMLLWASRTEKLWIFCLCAVSGMGLLYFTGTRLTYYGAVLISAAFLLMFLVTRKPLLFCVPLAAALVLLLVFRGASPMAQRQAVSSTSFSVYQEKINEVMGEDSGFAYREGEEIPPETLEKIKTVYQEIYGGVGVYGEAMLGDLIDRFGLERVMEEYGYSLDSHVLNDLRVRKLKAMSLIWEEKDALTRLLGFEYAEVEMGGNIYDPENDFPALPCYLGYLGTALYAAFLLSVLIPAVIAFFRRFPSLLTVEFGTAVLMLALGLGAAQFSGQVLRRPNVTVYLSLAAAALLTRVRETRPADRLRPGHSRNPAVSMKKV